MQNNFYQKLKKKTDSRLPCQLSGSRGASLFGGCEAEGTTGLGGIGVFVLRRTDQGGLGGPIDPSYLLLFQE